MSDACVLAIGAISALGVGRDAYAQGAAGERARVVIKRDPALENAGLLKPFAARATPTETPVDPATWLLTNVLEQVCRSLDETRPGWRNERLGLALGTSSGGMASAVLTGIRPGGPSG